MKSIIVGVAAVGILLGSSSVSRMQKAGGTTGTLISSTTTGGGSGAITAEYYNNADWTLHAVTQNETVGQAEPPAGIVLPLSNANTTGNGYSAVWSGWVKAIATGQHTFNLSYSSNGTGPINGWITVVGDGGANGTASILQRPISTSNPVSTPLTVGKTYKFILKLQSWNTGSQQKLTPTWSCQGVDADGNPITVSGNVPTSDVSPAVNNPVGPTDNYVVTTGDQKLGVYFTVPPNSSAGYSIYSALSPGGETDQAAFGVVALGPGQSGGGVVGWVDSPEPDGITRYYTAKLAYNNPVLVRYTMSTPSPEDFDAPNPQGIPWDSNDVSAVLAAIRNLNALDPDNPSLGSLRVAGPDGRIFEDGFGSVQPPDGTYDPVTSFFTFSNGEVWPIVDEGDPQNSTTPPIVTPSGLPAAVKGNSGGIYRRVRTDFISTGTQGQVAVPNVGNVVVGTGSGDEIFIYLGHSAISPKSECDAGLQWSVTAHAWNPYISYGVPGQGYDVNRPTSGRFAQGQTLTLTYYPRLQDNQLKTDVSEIIVQGMDTTNHPFKRTLGMASRVIQGQLIRTKRVHAISQPITQGETYNSTSGSFILGVGWHGGQFRGADLVWHPWTTDPTTENGAFPWIPAPSKVSFNQDAPFTDESSINLNPGG